MTIQIRRSSVVGEVADTLHVFPLRVEVVAVDGFSTSKIFVMHKMTHGRADVFEAVATLSTLHSFPEDAPLVEDGKVLPYYRVSAFTHVCLTASEAEQMWSEIVDCVDQLLKCSQALNNLVAEETATITVP